MVVAKVKPREIAMAAWKREGTRVTRNGKYRVTKFPKAVVVMLQTKHWERTTNKRAVVFPKPEHVGDFEKATSGVHPGGPAENDPGAIGSIGFNLFRIDGKPCICISWAQAHFRTQLRDAYPGAQADYVLPRKLATYYGGWRVHALGEILKVAKRNHLPVSIPPIVIDRRGRGMKPSQLETELNALADQYGFKTTNRIMDSGLLLTPIASTRSR